MRKSVLIAAAMGFMSSTAFAGSMAPMPPAYDWTGFYIGGNVGGAWLDPNTPAPNLVQKKSSGVIGGGFAGYNFEIVPS